MNTATISRVLLISTLLSGSVNAATEQAVSSAEQRLFITPHLTNTGAANVLRYTYVRRGSVADGFTDGVTLALGGKVAPDRREAQVHFLSGERAFSLPESGAVSGNPVILSFLERDVREMQRLTKGQANYFRKRVRMALADTATVNDIAIEVDGKTLPAWRISLTPYLQDPMRGRFEKYAGKSYEFVLSDQVPGWIYEMRTTIRDAAGAPLVEEVMRYQGSEP